MTHAKQILIVEDGDEYLKFAELFLSDGCTLRAAHTAREALELLAETPADGFLLDLRFDRSEESDLTGDIDEVAERLFAGDRAEAIHYLKAQQGTLILADLREHGHTGRAVFIHDFPSGRMVNLRRLYGDVVCFPSFDAAEIRKAFGVTP